MKIKKKTSFICPNCKEKQYAIGQIQNADILYSFDLKAQTTNEEDTYYGDFVGYMCLNCHQNLPLSIKRKLKI